MHCSTRELARKHGISHTTVGEIWRTFGLKPWRADSFKVSPDPDLVEKIHDLVGLYMALRTVSQSASVGLSPIANRSLPRIMPS
jgi:hypothetical protein